MSPALALSALTDRLQDPQAYCLTRQLHALRRVADQDPGLAATLVRVASERYHTRQAWGPATALAIAARRVGLSLAPDGFITGPDHVSLNILETTKHEVDHLVAITWAHHAMQLVSHRCGLHDCGPPWPAGTRRTLERLNESEVRVLCRHICGGFSTEAAKSKWDPEVDGSCQLCGSRDTREHRLLHCLATEHVRRPWRSLIDPIVLRRPHWVQAPFVSIPPNTEVPRLICRTRRLPPAAAVCPHWRQHGDPLTLYTDGSCLHPQIPWASLAAYSVVQDCSVASEQQALAERLWRCSGQIPLPLQVVAQGCVPGSQTINRAELSAVIQACRHSVALGAPPTRIGTDSMFVVNEWARLRSGGNGTYPDLTRALLGAWRRHFSVFKVRAHVDLHAVRDMEWWEGAANHAADVAAKQAVNNDWEFLRTFVDGIADATLGQADEHLLFARFLVAMSGEENRLKQQASRAVPADTPPGAAAQQDSLLFQRWVALSPALLSVRASPTLETDWLLASSWPPWFTWPLVTWLQQLQWGSDPSEAAVKAGTTYLELIANFSVVTHVVPPAGLEDAFAHDSPDHQERPRTLRQVVMSFVDATRQLERLAGVKWLPARKTKCTSLRCLGLHPPKLGVQGRPQFALPGQTFSVLTKLLACSSVYALLPCPGEHRHDMKAPQAVITAYGALDRNKRTRLARWLRGLRRT